MAKEKAEPKSKKMLTKFADESEKQAVADGLQASNTMVDLFKGGDATDEDLDKQIAGLERRNLPPMIKPDQIPIGMAVQGRIVKIVPSPSTEIKGRLLWLNFKNTDFCFPCTGSIRNALAPGLKDDDAKLDAVLEKEIGNFFYAKRLPNKPSKFKKQMFIFDVRTGKIGKSLA
jgi:hypothetical protein